MMNLDKPKIVFTNPEILNHWYKKYALHIYNLTMSGPENNTSFPSEADKTIAEGVTWEMQDNMIMDAAEYHAAKITVVDAVKVAEEKVAKIIADAVKVAEEKVAKIIADAVKVAEEIAAKIIADAEEKAAEIIADAVKVAKEKAAGVQPEAMRVAAKASTNVHSIYTYSGTRGIVDMALESSSMEANLSASKWYSPFMMRHRAITPQNTYRSKCLRLSSIPLWPNCKALSSLRHFVLLLTFLLRR